MMPAVHADTDETRYGALLDARLMGRFLRYVLPYRWWLGLALLLLPLTAGAQLLQPLVLRWAVDDHLASGQLAGFGWVVLAYGLLIVAQFGLGYLQQGVNALLGQRVIRDLRQAMFDHLLRLEAGFFSRHASGRLTNRLTNDTEAVSQMVSAGVVNLLGDLLLLVGIVASMIALSPHLSAITLLTLPLVILFTQGAANRLRSAQREGRLLQGRMAGQLTEACEGHQVVRLFRRQAVNQQAFDRLNRAYLATALDGNRWEALQFSVVDAAGTVVAALLIWYGATLTPDSAVSLGTLVAFIDYVRRAFLPIRDLSAKFTTLQAAMTALERIFTLLDTPCALVGPPLPDTPPPRLHGAIAFEGVSFGYGRGEILHNISLTIAPGERIALVGPTGAGKSSLIRLLNRTYDPTAGQVRIDGRLLEEIPLPHLRRQVGVVQQESFLFAGTIADNVGLMDAGIDRERIRWALAQTGVLDFVEQLPLGLDAPVAERGVNFSAGQRQLLGLARVLAHDPAILVMDEATSAVDAISERLFQQALERLLEGRTALIVAHRLSTIRHVNRIVVISQGHIAEQGNHDQLLAQDGLYAQLVRLQFLAEPETD